MFLLTKLSFVWGGFAFLHCLALKIGGGKWLRLFFNANLRWHFLINFTFSCFSSSVKLLLFHTKDEAVDSLLTGSQDSPSPKVLIQPFSGNTSSLNCAALVTMENRNLSCTSKIKKRDRLKQRWVLCLLCSFSVSISCYSFAKNLNLLAFTRCTLVISCTWFILQFLLLLFFFHLIRFLRVPRRQNQELECQVLQSLLFCMHAFLTAKVASVDPQFLNSIQQAWNRHFFPF